MRLFWVCLVIFIALITVQAQAADRAGKLIEYCKAHSSTPDQRIACLENALNIVLMNGNVATAPPPSSQASQSPGDETPAASDDNTAAAVSAAGAHRPSGLGAEQVPLKGKAKERAIKAYRAVEVSTVVDFALNKQGKLILVLDNGQVWKQNNGDLHTVPLRDGDTPTVQIKRGAISGYRMNFIALKRTIIVRRIK